MTSKDIIKSVCHIQATGINDGGQGTAFFLYKNNHTYIVTNKHVLCGRYNNRNKLILQYNTINNNIEYITKSTLQLNKTKLMVSDKYDVALYPIDEIFNDLNNKKLVFNHYIIQQKNILIDYDNIDWIENVYIVGYPWTIKDIKTNRPIVIGGITSTPLALFLENKEHFLIDGGISKGSSGSPVFIKINDSYKLVGIIFGTINGEFYLNDINIENNYHIKNLKTNGETKINICIKSSIIDKL